MKTDYFVSWRQTATNQLFEKARYIAEQSQSFEVAERFIDAMQDLAEKLSYVGGAYNDQNIHTFPLKNGHSVRFLVVGNVVLITEFIPKGMNY
ncbi:TPA: type II toxin-antitoxin system RelE/ParE family toxin [Pasteurella multocida]|nr:type II toxin-antitoxin system RelE/ParE family toxin [Pasteurella multocida]HDX1177491.1 type II toxin-antitoxin system RelE/ParE family toxin [Pasteurella multocida]